MIRCLILTCFTLLVYPTSVYAEVEKEWEISLLSPVSYDLDCTRNVKAKSFCMDPVKYADAVYELLAATFEKCKADCDLDLLGNDINSGKTANNAIYPLSESRFILAHEDAELGAYGGGDVTLYLVKKQANSFHIETIRDDKGNILSGTRGWYFDPQSQQVGYSPVTNSVNQCGRNYIYRFSGDMLVFNQVTVFDLDDKEVDCSNVSEMMSLIPPEKIIKGKRN